MSNRDQRSAGTKAFKGLHDERCHFLVEGTPFNSVRGVFTQAVERGFTGALSNIMQRLTSGADTWDELCRPVNPTISAAKKKTHAGKRAEMAAVIAELDARKKAMGLDA